MLNLQRKMQSLFYIYGKFCASNPWEVIMTFVTLTICILTIEHQQFTTPGLHKTTCPDCIKEAEYNAIDVIIMTFIRCLAILYNYSQFRTLHKMGSKYTLAIAGLFPVLSSFIVTSLLINFFQIEVLDLKDTLFFFLLLVDVSKSGKLAQLALSGLKRDVPNNIAKGMSALGPIITLDTIVETLLIGVGTLSGIHRLEIFSYLICLSVIVNYVIFITFYPACLSLTLELSNYQSSEGEVSLASIDEDKKTNPLINRIKLIMSGGLILVHAYSRFKFESETKTYLGIEQSQNVPLGNVWKWIALSTDHIVILVVLLALLAKFYLFESEEQALTPSVQVSEIKYDKAVQTCPSEQTKMRKLSECLEIYKSSNAKRLTDEEVVLLVKNKHISVHQIEKAVEDNKRGVKIRRLYFEMSGNFKEALQNLLYDDYDYDKVMGACCENVIGYVSIPVGLVGPLRLDGNLIYVPLATTESLLIKNMNISCKALSTLGVTSKVVYDGMTRGPVVRFPSLDESSKAMSWLQAPNNFQLMKATFDKTSRFARLKELTVRITGRCLFLRFVATSGDAMGMNMISKGTEKVLDAVKSHLPLMEILSLSGNYCTDKKSAAVNWIQGRGKSVVCEAIISSDSVQNILKTTTHNLIDVNISKNLIGSALSGSIGGYNSNASNIVSAIFIATGQDPAQNVCSSNCLTLMEPWGMQGSDLYISCTMPSIEVGTLGGGTMLPAQSACLDILGVRNSQLEHPGLNSSQLARIICACVLAGELFN